MARRGGNVAGGDDRRGGRGASRYEDEEPRNSRANFANIKAFCQIARRAFSEEEIQTIASMLADTRGPSSKPTISMSPYDERDVRNQRGAPRAERGGRRGATEGGRTEGGRGGRAERGGRSNANEGGRGAPRAERGGRTEARDEGRTEGGRRRNNRRPTA